MTRSSGNLICGRSREDFFRDIEKFHGHPAPGLVLGGIMVDWAQTLVGPGVEADAIVETCHCLPDAVQIFTPCTVGNGWLKIVDWDKFALTLYDKHTRRGWRVWLDLEKTRQVPDLYNWYMRRVPKHELPLDVILKTILDAGRSPLSARAVRITRFYEPRKKGNIAVCSGCGEAFPTAQGACCAACSGQSYTVDENELAAPPVG